MTLLEKISNYPTQALLVGLNFNSPDQLWHPEESIEELSELAKTAGIPTAHRIIQARSKPHPQYYMGIGKLEEIKEIVHLEKIPILITDDELKPLQQRNLERFLEIKILDRTALILDIFAKRAHSYEAQLQVELAQSEYLMPRLTRMWTHLSRLGGGIGTRGPGEKQIEVDRRQIRNRINTIKKKLKRIETSRELRREKRQQIPLLTGAIVGYTNAGKSSLMHALTDADTFIEDKLFATLDPKSKKLILPSKQSLILTDTVGFIQKLPHHLVEAFHSTLEAVTVSNFLVHVVDASHSNIEGVITTAQSIIKELDATHIPQLFVFNKMDQVKKPNQLKARVSEFLPQVFISVKAAFNFEELYDALQNIVDGFQKDRLYKLPYNRMDIFNLLKTHGLILDTIYEDDHMAVSVRIHPVLGDKITALLK